MNLKYIPAALLIATLAGQALVADTTGPNLNIGTSNTLAPSSSSGAVGEGNDLSNATNSFFIGGGNLGSSPYPSNGSLVVGEENTIDNLYDGLTVGYGNYNSAASNLVAGEYNTVIAEAGIVVGDTNYVNADHIAAFGEGLIYENSDGFGGPPVTIVGGYNAEIENPLFVVGNGADPDNRHNALEVTQDGNVTIPKRQGDVGMGRFGNTGDQ